MAEWSADQLGLVSTQREYWNLFKAIAERKHELPPLSVLEDYGRFVKWRDAYFADPDIGENPYKKYNHGFSVPEE